MIKKSILSVGISLLSILGVNAFSTSESFLVSDIAGHCTLATDGCNSYVMKDRTFLRSSSLICQNSIIKWECVAKKTEVNIDNFIDIKQIESQQKQDFEKEQVLKKTLEHTSALSNNKNIILSAEQQLIQKLHPKYVRLVDRFVIDYNKILSVSSIKKRAYLEKKIQTKVEKKVIYFQKIYNNPNKKQQQIIYLLQYLQLKIS